MCGCAGVFLHECSVGTRFGFFSFPPFSQSPFNHHHHHHHPARVLLVEHRQRIPSSTPTRTLTRTSSTPTRTPTRTSSTPTRTPARTSSPALLSEALAFIRVVETQHPTAADSVELLHCGYPGDEVGGGGAREGDVEGAQGRVED